jgi:hypothetical protein
MLYGGRVMAGLKGPCAWLAASTRHSIGRRLRRLNGRSILGAAILPEFPFLLNFREQFAQFLHRAAVPPFNVGHRGMS